MISSLPFSSASKHSKLCLVGVQKLEDQGHSEKEELPGELPFFWVGEGFSRLSNQTGAWATLENPPQFWDLAKGFPPTLAMNYFL